MGARISVVVTTHNYGHYLGACLDSVQAQTLCPCDVVVVDDDSLDHTEEVVSQFPDVRYFRVHFRNGNRARNFGFSKVSSDYVVFFDADNAMMPHFLATLYRALSGHETAAFAYCDRINVADGDVSWYPMPLGLWRSGEFDVYRLKQSNYIDLASLIRADRFPGFDETIRRYQDWDLWLNMALTQREIGLYVPEALFQYRVHGKSVSRNEDRDRAVWAIRRKYGLGWGALPLLRHSFWGYQLGRRFWRWLCPLKK